MCVSRWLISTVLLLGALALAAGPAPAQEVRTLRVNVFSEDGPTLAARTHGLFAAEGVAVEITATPNSTAQMRGLSDGTFDVAFTAFDNVLAWSAREGAEIVAIGQSDAGAMLPVFVRPEIRTWDDLRDKPLAVDAVDTAFALVLRRILLEHGLDLARGDYTFVPVGQTQPRLDSMSRGDTFAGIISPPNDVQALAAGLVRLGDQLAVLPDYPGGVIAVNRAWAQANRAEVVGFLRGWIAGRAWVEANRDAATDLLASTLSVSRPAAASRLALVAADPALNVAGLQNVIDLRNQFGYTLTMGPDLARYYDQSYYQAATGQ